jgi:hypothetical protein
MRRHALASLSSLSVVALPVVLALGCSGSSTASNFEGDGGSGDDGGGTGDGGINLGDASFNHHDGGTGTQGCSDAAKLVYVLSSENDLYSFDPPSKTFTKIGQLGCNTQMTPNSMAVDRNATAWVNYVESDPITGKDTNGKIFKVSTADASCQPTSIGLIQNWYRIGMGFSTNSATGTDETLFVAATGGAGMSNGQGLGSIDLVQQRLVTIGGFSGSLAGQSAELTGTGDARLFGFFTTTPVQVAQINKTSGGITTQRSLNGVETPAFWAFSFWGGDFYLYTAPDATLNPGRTTNVTHYSPASNTIDTSYKTNIGFHIVGAGVSTCAPTAPPK